jgi:hypothetical protein
VIQMLRSKRSRAALATLLCLPGAAGCFYSRRAADVDTNPTVDTGMGASILMPGQSAPALGVPGGSGPAAESAGSTPEPRPRITMIGGSSIDKERHETGKEDPLLFKALTVPFAVLAAPFAAAADALRGDPEPGPPVPQQAPERPAAPPPAPPPLDYETQQLQVMERELERRAPPAGAAAPPPQSAAAGTAPAGAPPSIADELADLQRAPQAPQLARAAVAVPLEAAPGPLAARGAQAPADGIVDRDEDGRIDLWIYRQDGEIVRKTLDQDFDGRPDTTLHYDPATHRLSRAEEDSDRDGATDSWTDYREGQVARRRADSDGDGTVDTWTFYRDGEVSRHERDTSGDGFRDRVGFYAGGRLVREEEDHDGDGRADVTLHYDEREQVLRREEDSDGDGRVDVISHYENGRLARRELLSGAATATP